MNGLMRFLRWLGVTVWFGIIPVGLSYLILFHGFNDPRDPSPDFMSAIGCLLLIAGWLGLSTFYAIKDRFPDGWDKY